MSNAARYRTVAAALSALYVVLTCTPGLERGLVRTIQIGSGAQATTATGVTMYIGSESFDKEQRDAGLPAGRAFEWTGVWNVPAPTSYDLSAGVHDDVRVIVDGQTVLERDDTGTPRMPAPLALTSGPHRILVTYVPQSPDDELQLSWAANGSGPRPFGQAELYPNVRTLRAHRQWLAPLGWAAVLAWLVVAVDALKRAVRWWRRAPVTTIVVRALLVCVVAYAALLRFDALVERWGPIPGSANVQSMQSAVGAFARHVRPDELGWARAPYRAGGDPYSYLQQAREQSNFYAAHLREPVFPFSVKALLPVLGQADLSVCVASALFSLLTVVAVYLTGSEGFSPWAGLGAAFGLALSQDIIGFGVLGNRDDAFAFFVMLVAYVSLRAWRRPSTSRAVIWGIVAGLACLTRITALSFVIPTLAWLVWCDRGPSRYRSGAWAAGVLALIVAPFLLTAWIHFGTPFYSVTGVARWDWGHGDPGRAPEGPSQLFAGELRASPVHFADTIYSGVIRSFEDKWIGLGVWFGPWMNGALSILALAGLAGFCWLPQGRFLLLLLASSTGPFFLGWNLLPAGAQYRYTLHEYPIFLIAASFAVERLVVSIVAATRLERTTAWPQLRLLARNTVITIVVCGAGGALFFLLPYFRMREDLRHDGQTMVVAGPRDQVFFRTGWSGPTTIGNVTFRDSWRDHSTIWLPMTAGRDVLLTIRMNPIAPGDTSAQIALTVNGHPVTTFTLNHDPNRFGSYVVEVPRAIVGRGLNRLDLTQVGQSKGLRLWYVIVTLNPDATRAS